jgi:hypothetical protein
MAITSKDANAVNALNPSFCLTEEWRICLPNELQDLPEAAWMQKSREGRWCGYMRILGKRSAAVWSRKEISYWFFAKWGVTHPGCISRLVSSGFPEPDQLVVARHDREMAERRKARAKKMSAAKKKAKAAKVISQ